MANTDSKYYPSRSDYQSHQQWQDMVNLHTQVYGLQDAAKTPAPAPTQAKEPPAPQGPTNSTVVGLPVSGSPTANGQKLTWNSTTNQLEWT